MAWPTDQDYNEAIQNPSRAFADLELQSGQVESSAIGIPKARAGNFATVYKVVSSNNTHAVRCFRYHNTAYGDRYREIASHLDQTSLSCIVSFHYMSQGIRVGSNWYPILKMKWVEGDSLGAYVEKNLSSPAALRRLGAAWTQMLGDLHAANVAHGDLQHGNVMVVHDNLKLVDYDGMYVPAMSGSRGPELGHRNYQHPERTDLDFGPHLDNFSAWLIYLSLVALAVRPSLWQELNAGDECLLFRKEDLAAPERSAAFRLVKELPDEHVRRLVGRVEEFLWWSLDQIPPVTKHEIDAQAKGVDAAGRGSWIIDHVPGRTDKATVSEEDDFPLHEAGPSWITEHLPEPTGTGSFVSPDLMDRLITIGMFFIGSLLCWLFSAGRPIDVVVTTWIAGLAATAGIATGYLRVRYVGEPAYSEIRQVRADVRQHRRDLNAARLKLEDLKMKRKRQRDTYSDMKSELESRQEALRAEEKRERDAIDADLRRRLSEIKERRRSVTTEEGTEKRMLAGTMGTEIARISRELAILPDHERQELARLDSSVGGAIKSLDRQLQESKARKDADLKHALKEYQDQIVDGHLHRIKITDAAIVGIGPELKRRLATSGYISAADIGTRNTNVPGIGTGKWGVLHDWRRKLEGPIRAREAPKCLPAHKTAAIEHRHAPQIRRLQQNVLQERARLTSGIDATKRTFADRKGHLEQQRLAQEHKLSQRLLALDKRLNDVRGQLARDEQEARRHFAGTAEECRVRLQAASKELLERAKLHSEHYDAERKSINADLEAAAEHVRQARWTRDIVARKSEAYSRLSFANYLGRAFGPRRSGS